MAIFALRDGDELAPPKDIGLVIDGVEVLNNMPSIASACAMLFGLTYAVNLSYPVELKYTFETFQKIIMDIDGRQMSRRVQNLCAKLQEWKHILSWLSLAIHLFYVHDSRLMFKIEQYTIGLGGTTKNSYNGIILASDGIRYIFGIVFLIFYWFLIVSFSTNKM